MSGTVLILSCPTVSSDGLAEDLVSFQVEKLRENRELHDKVEFEIALTCLDFDSGRRLAELTEAGFAHTDVAELELADSKALRAG